MCLEVFERLPWNAEEAQDMLKNCKRFAEEEDRENVRDLSAFSICTCDPAQKRLLVLMN